MAANNITVNVVVAEQGPHPAGDLRNVVVTSPRKSDPRVRANFGDTVEWIFQNGTGFNLQLGVGNFRAADEDKGKDENRILPVEPLAGTAYDVPVSSKGTGALKCRVKLQPGPPPHGERRTFKYDIVDYSRLLVLLDPELEVYP